MNRSKQGPVWVKGTIIVLLIGLAFAFVDLADAQQAKKVPTIGILTLIN